MGGCLDKFKPSGAKNVKYTYIFLKKIQLIILSINNYGY